MDDMFLQKAIGMLQWITTICTIDIHSEPTSVVGVQAEYHENKLYGVSQFE